jgi:gamma-glutamyl hydrolase
MATAARARPTGTITDVFWIAKLVGLILLFSALDLAYGCHNCRPAAPPPVIGVMTQPIPGTTSTYIAASYIKWIEAGGARSIPIPYDAPPEMVEDLFSQVNGVLFPGGGSDLSQSAVDVWRLANQANANQNKEEQDFFPIWGTCLGFEWLLELASGNSSILESDLQAENISLPLLRVDRYQLYQNEGLYRNVQKNNITMNNHHQGISPQTFLDTPALTNYWKITSVNRDVKGKLFVSTMEPVHPQKFPVYGVQYHPEKNAFEYATFPHTDIPYEAIDHSPQGIRMSLELASFFIDLARTNQNQRNGKHEYTKPDTYPLVYSYPMRRGVKFEQTYMIPPSAKMGGVESNLSKPLL